MKIDVVSASAGTGKTHRLTEDLVGALLDGSARPEGVVAITYTVKAAGELQSRIRERLLLADRPDLAARVRDGYLGTIHSVCQRLLREFALDAGLSPWLEPIPEPERRRLFDVALAAVLAGREGPLNELARRLEVEDWREPLLAIVDAARANGMDRDGLARSAAASRAGLEALLGRPTVDAGDYRRQLEETLRPLAAKLEELARETDEAAARARAAAARKLVTELDRGLLPSWKGQLQLARDVDRKKLSAWSDAYVAVAGQHHASAGFHDDLLAFQDQLLALAGEALGVFVSEKTAAGVVDFGDMLARAREALERPAVQAALRARLDLVLVDEFQDTSPLQLAVVSALAGVARRSIWVGDRKQAIFGFQGTDPELMTAATQAALGGRPPDILDRSWRARPDLVAMTSDLFARALAPHGFPPEQVRLVPARAEDPRLAAQRSFECWRWTKETVVRDGAKVRASEADAVAAGVAALLAAPPLVRERAAEDTVRPATFRDVAILARSNGRCEELATALRARGIPARVALGGVTLTPEGVLARAALALLADARDGVAALEVAWLGGAPCADPDGWLSRRLLEVSAWRAAADAAARSGERPPPAPLAFEDDPRVAGLRGAAAAAARLSPAEALDLALRTAGVAELVRAWPEPAQRLANLEALRAEAAAYEALCETQRSAATMLGLAAHLASLDEDDGDAGRQAAPAAEDAVSVLTWHRAKGLEWPVVVLSHLDFDRERGAFDVGVEAAPAFDFARPLDGRWIRFWPWPYGRMSANLALLGAAAATPEARRAAEADRRERLRLLYVGFTRARDLLVLAAGASPRSGPDTAALGVLVDDRGDRLLALPLAAAPGVAQLAVAGRAWPCAVRAPSGLPPAAAAPPRRPVPWFAPAPRLPRPPERLNPSAEPLAGAPRVVRVERLGERHALAAAPDQAGRVGDAIHAFLAADLAGPRDGRLAMAARILKGFRVVGAVAPAALLAASDALRAWVEGRYPGAAWFREWPVRARLGGPAPRLLVGEVDLFLELPDGFVLVDHKSFPGGEAERDRRLVDEYAPQLGWYARTLADALGKPMHAAFIHLPVRGEIAEVAL